MLEMREKQKNKKWWDFSYWDNIGNHTLWWKAMIGMRSWWRSKNRNQSLSCIPKSVLRTCEETLRFFCNSLARFLLLLSCWNDGRVTSGLSLWLNVARAKRRWIFNLLQESSRIISIRHKRHVSSERHSRAWLRCDSVSISLSRILMLRNCSICLYISF